MMDSQTRNELAGRFGAIASQAGKLIMAIYADAPRVDTKPDGSPVSDADRESERLIREQLSKVLPDVPLVAEESFDPARCPQVPERFLLVDPLDGTREFISRNGEFTVNIALIDNGHPIVGCVYAPACNAMYIAGAHAFHATLSPGAALPPLAELKPIATRPYPQAGLSAVASRSHLDANTQNFLKRLPIASHRNAGSSLKFCVIAQGEADVYPRLAPTMEWDTAAGQAVLVAAGGCVIGTDGAALRYGKAERGFRNDGFVAWGRSPLSGAANDA
ncbi:MAG: 3'(2'),5'-bisphosphate nucleotidase CysQ [Xanthobacteraceae bacterium]|nr:3'(2'),5'-bisphosphate nucleotidase CysQ [Xanthobacteraceae bacterium]MBV9631289.1 3'(2'),5'-bisphosphate nucleotidase CysQ [Xanthobacteraceae bacterium]